MPTVATSATLPIGIQVLSAIFMIGAVRGAILLIKDAIKHTWFAKIIRWISAIVQLASIVGSVCMMLFVFNDTLTSWGNSLVAMMIVIAIIGFISIVTNIRGGILLFKESIKNKWFNKRIRIICGIIMIVTLLMSFFLGV